MRVWEKKWITRDERERDGGVKECREKRERGRYGKQEKMET